MLLPVAHAGHWAVWVLYAVPVIAVLIAAYTSSVRTRRFEAEQRDAEAAKAEEPPVGSP